LPTLKTGFMLEEYEKKKQKQVSFMRSLMNYVMGTFFLCLGGFFFFREYFRIAIERFPANYMDKILGVICALYGAWRIYRGYKKNYFQ
jgi:hypothetical protein